MMWAIEYKAKNGRWVWYKFLNDIKVALFDRKNEAIEYIKENMFLGIRYPNSARLVKVQITRSDNHIVHDVCCPCNKCKKLREK